MNFKAKNEQLIELVIGASVVSANAQVFFQNQPQLQSITNDKKVYITAIETFSSEMMSGSPLTSGNAVASPAAILNATLSLNVAGTLSFNYMPLSTLVRVWTQAGTTPHTWDLHKFDSLYQVDWTKSYVTLINAPAATPFSYLFNVYYCYDHPDVS
jgi:hypothetical protein